MKKGHTYENPTGTGLLFERTTDLRSLLAGLPGLSLRGDQLYHDQELLALLCEKHKLYSVLLGPRGVDHKNVISARLLPDGAVFALRSNVLSILEVKFQEVSGSVDEKIATCDFKLKQYRRLVARLDMEVQFAFILSEWFTSSRYSDVLAYVKSVSCEYFFEKLPLEYLRLGG